MLTIFKQALVPSLFAAVITTVYSFVDMTTIGIGLGAGYFHRIHEVDRLSIATVLLMGVAFPLVGLLFPTQITKFFMSTTPEILEIAPGIIRIYFLPFLPMNLNIQATYYLQSVMQTTRSVVLSLLREVIFSGILVYVLPLWWGSSGVWWGMVFTKKLYQ